jgi:DNA-binding response OmpR family regulator
MRPARVLIIDNDENARAALLELLRDIGYEVSAARLSDAAAAAAGFAPDLVLLDAERLDWRGLRDAILRGLPDARLILMSARPLSASNEARILSKPIAIGELYRAVETAVMRSP